MSPPCHSKCTVIFGILPYVPALSKWTVGQPLIDLFQLEFEFQRIRRKFLPKGFPPFWWNRNLSLVWSYWPGLLTKHFPGFSPDHSDSNWSFANHTFSYCFFLRLYLIWCSPFPLCAVIFLNSPGQNYHTYQSQVQARAQIKICRIRKADYSAHSMAFNLCHPFLLARTGNNTITSLLSQKILSEGIKLDCALTPMLERKKKNLLTISTLSYILKNKEWPEILKLIQQNSHSKRPPTQRRLSYFDRTGSSSPKLTHTVTSHSEIRALCQFSKRQNAEPVPASDSV